MFFHVFPCFSMFFHVFPWFSMFFHVFPCFSMFFHVFPWIPWVNLPQLDGMPIMIPVRGSCRDADSYPFNHSSAEDGCEVPLVEEGGSIVEHREGYIYIYSWWIYRSWISWICSKSLMTIFYINLKIILRILVFETLVFGFYDFYLCPFPLKNGEIQIQRPGRWRHNWWRGTSWVRSNTV